ncbi:Pyruvate dehydrogenase E1 component subunit beta-3, chloroplastic [Vitis vinifera]|uniref:pyruvate dehydrogenase (acetyl-transferring) n=1 Tax=Vitis vinifera TaxID=29760 RepID=A0A438JQP1_VITVI|nr:Pyruvate dehydrogenase E1 component subunit beta-3, chloroplastic [Vitis vinifera]
MRHCNLKSPVFTLAGGDENEDGADEAMAAIFQGIGAAAAAAALPPAEKFHSQSPRFVSARKGSLFVVRSDGRPSLGSSPRSRGAQRLITNAVAAKADASVTSTASKPGHELLLFEALREGLEEEMDRDPRVCVMGEDVGHYGGSYKVTKGLATKYGDLRVLDTPIAENSFTGMGIGAAMTGLRPIIEG